MENEEHNQSEVARLTKQIADEYEAGRRGLQDLALGTSQHQFITARMESMGKTYEELADVVGNEQAARILVRAMEGQSVQSACISLPSSWKMKRATRAWLERKGENNGLYRY
jgi:hypothetical protein